MHADISDGIVTEEEQLALIRAQTYRSLRNITHQLETMTRRLKEALRRKLADRVAYIVPIAKAYGANDPNAAADAERTATRRHERAMVEIIQRYGGARFNIERWLDRGLTPGIAFMVRKELHVALECCEEVERLNEIQQAAAALRGDGGNIHNADPGIAKRMGEILGVYDHAIMGGFTISR